MADKLLIDYNRACDSLESGSLESVRLPETERSTLSPEPTVDGQLCRDLDLSAMEISREFDLEHEPNEAQPKQATIKSAPYFNPSPLSPTNTILDRFIRFVAKILTAIDRYFSRNKPELDNSLVQPDLKQPIPIGKKSKKKRSLVIR